MDWGESSETLMDKYSEIDFLREIEMGMTAYSYTGYVGGIETRIGFCFINNQFVAGVYQFTPERGSYLAKDFVKDFDNISAKLQSKYEMNRSDTWYNEEMYTGGQFGFDYYLKLGDVALNEVGFNEGTLIVHYLSNSEGVITHYLMYARGEFIEKLDNSLDDEF